MKENIKKCKENENNCKLELQIQKLIKGQESNDQINLKNWRKTCNLKAIKRKL